MSDKAVLIKDVCKEYRLGALGGRTLREDVQSWYARRRGKQDPNLKIGQKEYTGNARFLALNHVNFEVRKGDALGLIGHNGAGKSTLLKLISRVTAPSSGEIAFNGRIASMLEVGTGFHPELTGRENVYMNGAILGMRKSEIDKKFDAIVDFSEVEQFIDTPVKRYSSGMYVKLAFSVAAHLDSEIMIMDEVLAVGDSAFQKKCLTKMREAAQVDGKTVIYVSHNMDTIRSLCNRCIVLNNGTVLLDGSVSEGVSAYLGIAGNEYSKENDFSKKEHYEKTAKHITLNHFTFKNTEDGVYKLGGQIVGSLSLHSMEDFEKVQLMIIYFKNDGTRIAMSESDPFMVCKGENKFELALQTDCFVAEHYYTEVSILTINEHGDRRREDCVMRAFAFSLSNSDTESMTSDWKWQYWGNMNAKSIRVVREFNAGG